jgi:hypothetical protein
MRRLLRIGQSDDAATIQLLMLLVVPPVRDNPVHHFAIAVVGLQSRRRVAIGIVRLCVHIGAHPVVEVGELPTVLGHARHARGKPGFEIEVEAGGIVHGRLRNVMSRGAN